MYIVNAFKNFFCYFREYRNKYFNESDLLEDETVLRYTQLKTFHFSSSTSQNGASEDDVICTINIPLIVSNHFLSCMKLPGTNGKNASIIKSASIAEQFFFQKKVFLALKVEHVVPM